MTTSKKVSVLVPCYNEEASLPAMREALLELMNKEAAYQWEVLFINDGSKDKTLQILRQIHREDSRFRYLDLSRNFGKENAMLAGFDYATGDCLVIMDADLQHPPHVVSDMLRQWEEGYEDVYGKRLTRGKESWLRKQFSLTYYKLLQSASRFDVLQNVGDFRLLDRRCIEALKQLRETERYTKGMFAWIGFKKKEVYFEQQDRLAGTSSWNAFGLFRLAIEGITSFTVAPLKWASIAGLIVSLIGFLYLLFVLFKTLFWGESVQGYPTLLCVILVLGGLQLLFLGVMGEYLGRIFNETKHRPVYLVREKDGEKV